MSERIVARRMCFFWRAKQPARSFLWRCMVFAKLVLFLHLPSGASGVFVTECCARCAVDFLIFLNIFPFTGQWSQYTCSNAEAFARYFSRIQEAVHRSSRLRDSKKVASGGSGVSHLSSASVVGRWDVIMRVLCMCSVSTCTALPKATCFGALALRFLVLLHLHCGIVQCLICAAAFFVVCSAWCSPIY